MNELKSAEDFVKLLDSWINDNLDKNEKNELKFIIKEYSKRPQNKDQDIVLQEISNLFLENYEKSVTGNAASMKMRKLMVDLMNKKENILSLVEADIQEFKMMEAFTESFPQFVLQTCAMLNTDSSFRCLMSDRLLQLTLLSSLISVVSSVTTTFMKYPHVINGKKEPKTHYWKNYIVTSILMVIIVTPRLVVFSVFFACCRYLISTAFIGIALITYSIPYWTYIHLEFKGREKVAWKQIAINYGTSIIGPCIVIEPTSKLVFYSCLTSMAGHIILLASVQMSTLLWPHLFIIPIDHMANFSWLFIFLQPIIILTNICSYFQLEEEKQIQAEINEHKLKEAEERKAKLAARAEIMEKKRAELQA